MALSRTAVLLLLLPVPGVVYFGASMEGIAASYQCLPSRQVVQQQYPGAWASWSRHLSTHRGQKCWFPMARETHSHRTEAALRRAARRAARREARARHEDTFMSTKAQIPVADALQLNELGWNFRASIAILARAAGAGSRTEVPSSFEDRFDAAKNVTSVRKPSVIQRMMDPVGAIPNMP